MSKESTTPDLVELTQRFLKTGNRRDFDAGMSFCAPDAVCESMGMATRFEGVAAIRGFFEDFIDANEEYRVEPEEILDLGNGVVLALLLQNARLAGSSGHVRLGYAAVSVWIGGLVERSTNYGDVDEARAAAERLAESRGGTRCPRLWFVSGEPYRGYAGIEQWLRDIDEQSAEWRFCIDRAREVGNAVLAIGVVHGRGRASSIPLQFPSAIVFYFGSDYRVTRARIYPDVNQALKVVGLSG